MSFSINNGQLCFRYKKFAIENLSVILEYRGNHHNKPSVGSGIWAIDGSKAVSMVEGVGKFTLTAKKTDGGIAFNAYLRTANEFCSRKCVRLIISGRMPIKAEKFLYNEIGEEFTLCDFDMLSKSKLTATVANQKATAMQYVAFKGRTKERANYYGVLGAVTFNEHFSVIELCENGEFTAFADFEENIIEPNSLLKTDTFFLCIEYNNPDILSEYGKKIAKCNPIERGDAVTGWCSWYYYGSGISEQIILENMRQAKANEIPIKYVQIDDGWQKNYGDWEENEKFQNGMKHLADEIKKAGYVPGIWFSPFLVDEHSELAKNHPDWFVQGENGKPLPELYIDYSVKGAREWLYRLAKKFSQEWGYRYIKIDLISLKLAMTGYKKKGFNALKNFKTAIKIMRSAVTGDTRFMTCTCPMGASAGIAECLRISGDIFERWISLKDIARQVLRRYFMAEYINTDPDCLMVRHENQHDDEAFRICTRTDEEIQTFINFMSVAGGAIMLSDKLSLLGKEDIDRIKTLFPINQKPAKPLDIFDKDIPSVFYYGESGEFEMYALFNWENYEDTLTIDLKGEKYAKTYYENKAYEKAKTFEMTLKPHTSEIVYVAKNMGDFNKLQPPIMQIAR